MMTHNFSTFLEIILLILNPNFILASESAPSLSIKQFTPKRRRSSPNLINVNSRVKRKRVGTFTTALVVQDSTRTEAKVEFDWEDASSARCANIRAAWILLIRRGGRPHYHNAIARSTWRERRIVGSFFFWKKFIGRLLRGTFGVELALTLFYQTLSVEEFHLSADVI